MPAGKAGSPGTRLGARPAPRPVARQRRVEIVAERRGQRALVAGRGLDMVDRPVAARALDRLEQRLRLGLRARPARRAPTRASLSAASRAAAACWRRLSARRRSPRPPRRARASACLAPRPRGLASMRPERASSPSPPICSSSRAPRPRRGRALARAASSAAAATRASACSAACTARAWPSARLGGARLVLMLDACACRSCRADASAAASRAAIARQLLARAGRAPRRRPRRSASSRARSAARVRCGAPPARAMRRRDAVALGAKRGEPVAERGGLLARRFARPRAARRAPAPPASGRRRRRAAPPPPARPRRRHASASCLRRVGRRRGLAPAREDQPRLGDPDLVGELAVALGGPRLPPQRAARAAPCRRGSRRAGSRLASVARNFCSASLRRTWRPAIPAASSSISRRSVGLAAITALILPWLTRAGEWAPVAASANSKATSFCADVAAVDPIGRAGAALDPPGDLDLAERRQRDVAAACRRPRARRACDTSAKSRAGRERGAGEDHVVHAGAAHRLGRAFAHHPADRLEHVRLAAAIRPDDAGQARPRRAAPPARRSS